MEGKYQRILSAIKESSPLLGMIEQGFKPEEIKNAIIQVLEPYFDNKDILEQFAIEGLVPEAMNLLKLQTDKDFCDLFKKCFHTYRSSRSKDPQTCFKSCALWQPHIRNSVFKFWSISYLEVGKSSLEIEEFLHECLRNIGDIIEGLTKPYLGLLLHQVRIAGGIRTSFKDIESLDLGVTVDELIRHSGYADLFKPPPWGIKLNQWRNIAYHHTAKIDNNEIICWYGKAPNLKKIRLSRNELLKVAQAIFMVYITLKLSCTLFFVDNVKQISMFSPTIEIRDEALFTNFAAALASQGFEILEYKKNANNAILVVKDFSDLNPDKHRFHASQFLFDLWLLTRSKRLIVEYREKNNIPNLLVSTNSKICEKIYSGKLEPLTLAKRMKIVDLKTRKIIPSANDA